MLSSRPIDLIKSATDLITTREQTRTGFIEAALEKNKKSKPYIENAKTLKNYASKANSPYDLLTIPQIRKGLLTASGLSDKSLNYFTEDDKIEAIRKMIETFLVPAGDTFVDEFIYRYLLISGDSLGGTMRNLVGSIAETKLIRKLLSVMNMMQINHYILLKNDKKSLYWRQMAYESAYEDAEEIYAIKWRRNNIEKVLFFDTTIKIVSKNVDISLYDCTGRYFNADFIRDCNERAIMFGELKGGIDPAGADEHWKTGNTALERIRGAFSKHGYNVHTSFIAAAIEKNMATEIYNQLVNGTLSHAINLTYDNHLTHYCEWVIELEKK